jgi:hypothetical protein
LGLTPYSKMNDMRKGSPDFDPATPPVGVDGGTLGVPESLDGRRAASIPEGVIPKPPELDADIAAQISQWDGDGVPIYSEQAAA